MKVISKGNTQSGCLQHHKHFKNEFKCFPKEHMKWMRSTTKKLMTRSLFVALTAMAVTMSPVGGNVKDIWQSPDRLTAIENEINEINERIRFIEDEDRIITSASE